MTNLFLVTSFYWRLFVKMICITLKWNWFFSRLCAVCVCACGSLDFSFISVAVNWLFNYFIWGVRWLTGVVLAFWTVQQCCINWKMKIFSKQNKKSLKIPHFVSCRIHDQERTTTILKIIKLCSIELIDILRVCVFVCAAILFHGSFMGFEWGGEWFGRRCKLWQIIWNDRRNFAATDPIEKQNKMCCSLPA